MDYFVSHLSEPNEEPDFVVKAMDVKGVSGVWST
jgi:hypothetical protein